MRRNVGSVGSLRRVKADRELSTNEIASHGLRYRQVKYFAKGVSLQSAIVVGSAFPSWNVKDQLVPRFSKAPLRVTIAF